MNRPHLLRRPIKPSKPTKSAALPKGNSSRRSSRLKRPELFYLLLSKWVVRFHKLLYSLESFLPLLEQSLHYRFCWNGHFNLPLAPCHAIKK